MPGQDNIKRQRTISRPEIVETVKADYEDYGMKKIEGESAAMITNNQLQTILSTNQKAIALYLEIGQQYNEMIDLISSNKEISEKNYSDIKVLISDLKSKQDELNKKISEVDKKLIDETNKIDRNFFRLLLVLGSIGGVISTGMIAAIIKGLLGTH